MKRIRYAQITMTDGTRAVLSTAEISPGLYETMLASPDYSTEYEVLRTTEEAQSIGDFKHLKKLYSAEKLTGRYLELSKALKSAAAHGLEVAANTHDSGTCNTDAVCLYLPRWSRKKVEQAAKAAGVGCFIWNLYGDKSFVFPLLCGYQGNARTKAAEAMRDALKAAGYKVGMYYQMD